MEYGILYSTVGYGLIQLNIMLKYIIYRGSYMSAYVILKILNELVETIRNEALPSFVLFQTTSLIFSGVHKHEC